MRRSGYLAVGFDMDGTLLRTDVNYNKINNIVYDEMVSAGVPENALDMREGSKHNLDRGMRYLTENGLLDTAEEVSEMIGECMESVELENVLTARHYKGGERMLEHLKREGYGIGVLTRGSRAYAVKALTIAGAMDMLDALVCRDDHPEAEAKPSPLAMDHLAGKLGVRSEDVLYLGDHKMDYFCARDAGAGFIGVMTRHNEEYWNAVDENIRTIDTVADLMDIL